MRNTWPNTTPTVTVTCIAVTLFLVGYKFLSSDNNSQQIIEVEPPLTVSRQNVLQRLVTDHLLGDGDTFNEMFRFLSLLDDNCSSLLIPETQVLLNSSYFKAMTEDMQKALATAGKMDEGFSGQVAGQVMFYVLLARQPWVRQVCEIGFNGGHSALYWLASNNRTKLLSFDLGAHGYAKVMANYMNSAYPGRFEIVWGDSTKTVPEHVKKLQTSGKMLSCDVIVVDGGHSYEVAIADLRNMRAFAGSPRHLLLMDDTPCVAFYCDGPGKAWRELRHIIKPLFACMYYPDCGRGFSVGYYV